MGGPRAPRQARHVAVGTQTYRGYSDLLDSPRWERLAHAGARPQRLLWASAGTKDKTLSDVLYVEAHPAFNEEAEPEAHKDISPIRQVVLDAVRGQPHSPVDWIEIELIARQATGVPVATSITRSQAVVEQPAQPEAAAPPAPQARPQTKTAPRPQDSARAKAAAPQTKTRS